MCRVEIGDLVLSSLTATNHGVFEPSSRLLQFSPMRGTAERDLDAIRVYEAEISVSADLGPFRADGTESSAELAAAVDATQLRQYGQQLAENWELLARFLEYLKPRGWMFKGTSGDGLTAYGIIAKQGKPGELHADLSVLPAGRCQLEPSEVGGGSL